MESTRHSQHSASFVPKESLYRAEAYNYQAEQSIIDQEPFESTVSLRKLGWLLVWASIAIIIALLFLPFPVTVNVDGQLLRDPPDVYLTAPSDCTVMAIILGQRSPLEPNQPILAYVDDKWQGRQADFDASNKSFTEEIEYLKKQIGDPQIQAQESSYERSQLGTHIQELMRSQEDLRQSWGALLTSPVKGELIHAVPQFTHLRAGSLFCIVSPEGSTLVVSASVTPDQANQIMPDDRVNIRFLDPTSSRLIRAQGKVVEKRLSAGATLADKQGWDEIVISAPELAKEYSKRENVIVAPLPVRLSIDIGSASLLSRLRG